MLVSNGVHFPVRFEVVRIFDYHMELSRPLALSLQLVHTAVGRRVVEVEAQDVDDVYATIAVALVSVASRLVSISRLLVAVACQTSYL
jgi:hypothetical protein